MITLSLLNKAEVDVVIMSAIQPCFITIIYFVIYCRRNFRKNRFAYVGVILFFLKKKNLCGHCFGFMVTSPLGLKARVGSLIHTWCYCMCYTLVEVHPGMIPADHMVSHMTTELASSTYLSMHVLLFSVGECNDCIRPGCNQWSVLVSSFQYPTCICHTISNIRSIAVDSAKVFKDLFPKIFLF